MLCDLPFPLQGEPVDAESFIKIVKCEEVSVYPYRTFEEAQACLQIFLLDVYNTERLHVSSGYVPPDEFELGNVKC